MAIDNEKLKREPFRPLHIRGCVWCEKDGLNIPLSDCMMCQDSRDDGKTIYCSWNPGEKHCTGCGIPAEYCEPETCMLLKSGRHCRDRRRKLLNDSIPEPKKIKQECVGVNLAGAVAE